MSTKRFAFKGRYTALALALIGSAFGPLVFAPGLVKPAYAAHTPCGAFLDFFDGYETTDLGPQTTWGSSANIVNEQAATCGGVTSQNNFTIGWAMIAENNNGGGRGYAQTGFFHWPGNAMQTFAEDSVHGGAFHRTFGVGETSGSQTRYWEDYLFNPAQRWVSENVNNTAIQHTSFNPVGTWIQPFVSEFSGETRYVETDMPGTSTAESRFSVISYEDANGNFQGQLPVGLFSMINPRQTCSCYHQDTPAPQPGLGTVFDIWTNPTAR